MWDKIKNRFVRKISALLCLFIGLPLALWLLQWQGVVESANAFLYMGFGLAAGLLLVFRRLSFRLGMLLVILFSAMAIYQPPGLNEFVTGFNYRLRDFFFVARGPQKPTGEVVIVDLDNKSLQEVGQWPWPRTQLATLVDNLLADGAKAVGFDIVFPERDRLSLGDWAQRIAALGIDLSLPEVVGPEIIRSIVLREWGQQLQKDNPEFLPENDEGVVAEYLRQQEVMHNEVEQRYADRMRAASREYTPKPYLQPEDPLLDMARKSRELFYLSPTFQVVLDNDAALGEVFRSERVVAGGLFITPTSAGARVTQVTAEEARSESEGMLLSMTISGVDEVFWGMRQAVQQVINVPQIQTKARHQGTFNIVPDRSGSARYYTMLMRAPVYQETLTLKEEFEDADGMALLDPDNYETKIVTQYFTYPSITLEMLRVAEEFDQVEATYRKDYSGLLFSQSEGEGSRFLPLDYKADLNLNFRGYGGAWQPEYELEKDYYFSYVSMADAVKGTFPKGTFKDKYVLIGSTDATLSDLVGSPFRPAFPGLEVHATMLDNLVAGDYFLEDAETTHLWTFLGILIGGTIMVGLIAYDGPWVGASLMLATLTGLPLFSYYCFTEHHLIIDVVYPWLSLAILAIAVILVNYFVEGREKRFLSGQFAKMVSPEVLQKIQEDPSATSLKGQKAEISVLFSDVQGFTNISEALDPARLVDLLNDYLTPMADIILDLRGFIDKFMGDAIMAVWGVPFPEDDHAFLACKAALDQQKRLAELRPILKEEYGVDIFIRVGVSTGSASAAMMGSESRKSFTVMGDVVNLGARLEPACKDYGVYILICEKTYLAAKEHIHARCIDKLVVKGKSVPIPVYELMGMKGDLEENVTQKIELFEKALHTHWERNWDDALATLRDLDEIAPEDGPSHTLAARIEGYKETPPATSWQGEFVKTTK